MKMTRNAWSPEEVVSKDCKNKCGKRIYLDQVKRKFFDDPELTIFHHCPNYTEADQTIKEKRILEEIALLHSKMDRLRSAVWELHQKQDMLYSKLVK